MGGVPILTTPLSDPPAICANLRAQGLRHQDSRDARSGGRIAVGATGATGATHAIDANSAFGARVS